MPISKASKKTITWKPRIEENDGKDDRRKSREHSDVKQAAVSPSQIRDQAPFDEESSSEYMRSEMTLTDCHDKKLDMQLAPM